MSSLANIKYQNWSDLQACINPLRFKPFFWYFLQNIQHSSSSSFNVTVSSFSFLSSSRLLLFVVNFASGSFYLLYNVLNYSFTSFLFIFSFNFESGIFSKISNILHLLSLTIFDFHLLPSSNIKTGIIFRLVCSNLLLVSSLKYPLFLISDSSSSVNDFRLSHSS